MERIIGLLISGAVVRLAGAALAIYIGVTVGSKVIETLHTASAALALAH